MSSSAQLCGDVRKSLSPQSSSALAQHSSLEEVLKTIPNFTHITETVWPDPSWIPRSRIPETCICQDLSDEGGTSCLDDSCLNYATNEECGSSCPAGASCGNRRITKKKWLPLEVVPTPPKGYGLKALTTIPAKSMIMEYVGEAISKDELFSRLKNYCKSERMLYVLQMDKDVYLDARLKGGIARFINHSCEPNCVMERWKVKGCVRLAVFSLRAIQQGEELTFDYAWARDPERPLTQCFCGTKSCRGFLEMTEMAADGGRISPKLNEISYGADWQAESTIRSEGDWRMPTQADVGPSLIKARIKVYFDGNYKYFEGEVVSRVGDSEDYMIKYDVDNKSIYSDEDEPPKLIKENLSLKTAKWWIFDSKKKVETIKKKVASDSIGRLSPTDEILPTHSFTPLPTSSSVFSASYPPQSLSALPPVPPQSCPDTLFVIPRIHQELVKRCVYQNIQTKHRVSFNIVSVPRSSLSHEQLGTVAYLRPEYSQFWKVTVSFGLDQKEAMERLQNSVMNLGATSNPSNPSNRAESADADSSSHGFGNSNSSNGGVPSAPGNFPLGASAPSLHLSGAAATISAASVMIPPALVERVKTRESSYDALCRPARFCLLPFKPQQGYTELQIQGSTFDIIKAQGVLWKDIFGEGQSPKVVHLEGFGFKTKGLPLSSLKLLAAKNGCELSRFISDFNESQNCYLYIQSQESVESQPVSVRSPSSSIECEVFIGVEPSRLADVRGVLERRVAALEQGAKFVTVPVGKSSIPLIFGRLDKRFATFLNDRVGVELSEDPLSSDSQTILKLSLSKDSRILETSAYSCPINTKPVDWAERLLLAQIALVTRNARISQRWVFSGDYSSLPMVDGSALAPYCVEVCKAASKLELEHSTAAHACVLIYRFVALTSLPQNSQKIRELCLTALFIANKAHKFTKWKRLERVLECWYAAVYPGIEFKEESVEAKTLETRVLELEKVMVDTLGWQVAWEGADWIQARLSAIGVDASAIIKMLKLAFSPTVLSSGGALWLRHSLPSIFASCYALSSRNRDKLESVIALFKLHTGEVLDASRIIDFAITSNAEKLSKDVRDVVTSFKMQMPALEEELRQIFYRPPTFSSIETEILTQKRIVSLASEEDKGRHIFGLDESTYVEIAPFLERLSRETCCSLKYDKTTAEAGLLVIGNIFSIQVAFELIKEHLPASSASMLTLGPVSNYAISPRRNAVTVRKPAVGRTPHSVLSVNAFKRTNPTAHEAVVRYSTLNRHDLHWHIPGKFGIDEVGVENICDMDVFFESAQPSSTQFDIKSVFDKKKLAIGYLLGEEQSAADHDVQLTLKKWPDDKALIKEYSKVTGMGMGISASALQELQHLYQVHARMPTVKGHPNFLMPYGLVLGNGVDKELQDMSKGDKELSSKRGESEDEDDDDDEDDVAEGDAVHAFDDTFDDELWGSSISTSSSSRPVVSLSNSSSAETTSEFRSGERESSEGGNSHKSRKIDQSSGREHGRSRSGGGSQETKGRLALSFEGCSHIITDHLPIKLSQLTRHFSKKVKGASGERPAIHPVVLQSVFYDLLQALAHCHDEGIVLRHPDQSSFLVSKAGRVRVAAFSSASACGEKSRFGGDAADVDGFSTCVKMGKEAPISEGYLGVTAPEMLLGGQKFSRMTDVWWLGATMASLILGKPFFAGKDREQVLGSVWKICGVPGSKNFPNAKTFPYYKSCKTEKAYKHGVAKALTAMLGEERANSGFTGAIALIDKMLKLDPRDRISADEALEDDWMKDFVANSVDYAPSFAAEWLDLSGEVLFKSGGKNREERSALKTRAAADKARRKREEEEERKRKGYARPSLLGLETAQVSSSAAANPFEAAPVPESIQNIINIKRSARSEDNDDDLYGDVDLDYSSDNENAERDEKRSRTEEP